MESKLFTTGIAWRNYFERHPYDGRKDKINPPADRYDYVIAYAEDVLYRMRDYYDARVKHGYTKGTCVWIRAYPDIEKAHAYLERAEDVFWDVCYVTGVDQIAVMKAARAMQKFYARGGQHLIDAEKLIRALS